MKTKIESINLIKVTVDTEDGLPCYLVDIMRDAGKKLLADRPNQVDIGRDVVEYLYRISDVTDDTFRFFSRDNKTEKRPEHKDLTHFIGVATNMRKFVKDAADLWCKDLNIDVTVTMYDVLSVNEQFSHKAK